MSKGRAGKIEALREQAKEWQSAYECERADHETTAALTRSRTKPMPNDKMMTPELEHFVAGIMNLTAENQRLRAALYEIISLDHHTHTPASRATTIARDALVSKPE